MLSVQNMWDIVLPNSHNIGQISGQIGQFSGQIGQVSEQILRQNRLNVRFDRQIDEQITQILTWIEQKKSDKSDVKNSSSANSDFGFRTGEISAL